MGKQARFSTDIRTQPQAAGATYWFLQSWGSVGTFSKTIFLGALTPHCSLLPLRQALLLWPHRPCFLDILSEVCVEPFKVAEVPADYVPYCALSTINLASPRFLIQFLTSESPADSLAHIPGVKKSGIHICTVRTSGILFLKAKAVPS